MFYFGGSQASSTQDVKEPDTRKMLVAGSRDFSKDISALEYLIKHQVTMAATRVNFMSMHDNIILEEKVRAEALSTSRNLISALATEYRALLLIYYTEEFLTKYITEVVTINLLRICMDKNANSFKGETENRTDI